MWTRFACNLKAFCDNFLFICHMIIHMMIFIFPGLSHINHLTLSHLSKSHHPFQLWHGQNTYTWQIYLAVGCCYFITHFTNVLKLFKNICATEHKICHWNTFTNWFDNFMPLFVRLSSLKNNDGINKNIHI